jgi:hypothetical protein
VSFLYPNAISVRRAKEKSQVGDRGYGAQRGPGDEDVILAGPIQCSIQEGAQHKNPTGLPTDPRQSVWKVYVPKSVGIAKGVIKAGDFLTDEINRRFQVSKPIYTSLGFEIVCLFLEP